MKKIREWLKSKNISLPLVIVIIGLIASCCILSTCWMIVTSVESPPAIQVLTIIPMSTATQMATAIPMPAATQRPTWTPLPPKLIFPITEIVGVGSTVTVNFEFPRCQKAVFSWGVEPDSYGYATLCVQLWNTAKSQPIYLITEYASDRTEIFGGKTLQPLAGGEYYFVIDGTNEAWSIVVVCED